MVINRNGILFFVLASFLFLSCVRNSNKVIKDKLDQFYKKEIKLFTEHNISKDFKFVTYIDGSCGICIDEMLEWKSIVYQDSACVEFIFYFYAENIETYNILIEKCLDFDYPIIFDEKKKFLEENQLDEKDKIFTSLLLDKENKVLMVGNPIRNEEILKLYNKIIYK